MFCGKTTPDLYNNCCNANTLCEFDGDLCNIVAEPLYVQKVFDAVLFNLQGMRSIDNQVFKPNIPKKHRVKRVIDIRCKRCFNSACESRLATNNYGRDLCIDCNGQVTANLIIAICVTCEKKIVVPVELGVLSTGYVKPAKQANAICTTFPSLFPNQIKESDTKENCKTKCIDRDKCCDDPCEDACHKPACRPKPKR